MKRLFTACDFINVMIWSVRFNVSVVPSYKSSNSGIIYDTRVSCPLLPKCPVWEQHPFIVSIFIFFFVLLSPLYTPADCKPAWSFLFCFVFWPACVVCCGLVFVIYCCRVSLQKIILFLVCYFVLYGSAVWRIAVVSHVENIIHKGGSRFCAIPASAAPEIVSFSRDRHEFGRI